ncbi:hypothetical protein ACFFW8_23015 [Erwinia tracheiphila]
MKIKLLPLNMTADEFNILYPVGSKFIISHWLTSPATVNGSSPAPEPRRWDTARPPPARRPESGRRSRQN